MATVKLPAGTRQGTSDTVHTDVGAALKVGRTILNSSAAAIAAWWQAPAGVGRVLAAFASGLPVDVDELQDDIRASIAETSDARDRQQLRMLGRWADAYAE
jgi:uncharacterized membrane protein YczE